MFFLAIIIFAITGIFAGFFGGLLGIGGGLIAVPVLLLTFHLLGFSATNAMQVAVGTSLGAMVFTAASSAWAHYRQQGVNWHLFRLLIAGVAAGAILGALIADLLPSQKLAFIFGVFVFFIGVYFLLPTEKLEQPGELRPPHFFIMFTIGVIIGVISSILGIGGGIITVPILTAFRTPLRNAISTSAVIGFFIALIGAISFLFLGLKQPTFTYSIGYLYVPAFIFIGLTSSLAAPYGAKLAYTLPTHVLRRIFGVALILVGFLMIDP